MIYLGSENNFLNALAFFANNAAVDRIFAYFFLGLIQYIKFGLPAV